MLIFDYNNFFIFKQTIHGKCLLAEAIILADLQGSVFVIQAVRDAIGSVELSEYITQPIIQLK